MVELFENDIYYQILNQQSSLIIDCYPRMPFTQLKQNILKWQEDSKKLEKICAVFKTRNTPLIAKVEIDHILNEDSEEK